MDPSLYTYTLYTYFRSSCSARVRIAAYYKGIASEVEYRYIHLLKDEQHAQNYATLNPSESVPTLIVRWKGTPIATIRQSVAILEFLEETRPELPGLLPPTDDAVARAKVRELVNIIACDVQPVTNLRVLQRIQSAGIDDGEWKQQFTTAGLKAYEELAEVYAGRYSVGDQVTMADCVLAPAVDGALRFGVDIQQFPTISRIFKELEKIEAFRNGRWNAQPDTPKELRVHE